MNKKRKARTMRKTEIIRTAAAEMHLSKLSYAFIIKIKPVARRNFTFHELATQHHGSIRPKLKAS